MGREPKTQFKHLDQMGYLGRQSRLVVDGDRPIGSASFMEILRLGFTTYLWGGSIS
jgi:hypothetical protein